VERFKDHFSSVAGEYARHRPGYPAELFAFLASLPAERERAWDCATGNGQAAVGLAAHFRRVVGSDASLQQLARAERAPGVAYWRALAERTGLRDRVVDLVTAAQGVHWFDFDAFWREVRRVLVPGGCVAVWTSYTTHVDPAVDAVLARFRAEVHDYWPPERRWVEEQYRTIPFPFAEIVAPEFEVREEWDLERLLGYLGTWSATRRYRELRGEDPVARLRRDLTAAWGEPSRRRLVRQPIHLRAGRG
jgi:ubiquinone/menaquinone biosynthesis C-methylase UbiE